MIAYGGRVLVQRHYELRCIKLVAKVSNHLDPCEDMSGADNHLNLYGNAGGPITLIIPNAKYAGGPMLS